jgi:hypothetical protein
MTRYATHLNPPWTDLHERRALPPKATARARAPSKGDVAEARRRTEQRMDAGREKAYREFGLCSRPYF